MTDAALSTIRLKKALADKRGPKNPEGPELRMKREAAGITPKEAAAKLGISVQTIRRIEKGDAGEQSAAMKAYRALLNTGEHDGKDSEQENGSGDLHDAAAWTQET
jgi:DNA-binding XRE family transcriptional regulator